MKMFNQISVGLIAVAFTLGPAGLVVAATSINLGTAGTFGVLAGSTITNTGPTDIGGSLGLTPGTSVTGFPPGTVRGGQHITDTAAAQAEADLVTAYNTASQQTAGAVTVSGDLGGTTLTPGIYNSASSLGLTGTLTLDAQGNPNAVFIFQIGSSLTTASASAVNLINGTQACNVFWQVGSSATLGTNSMFKGTILALTSITLTTGANVQGGVLARNGAVTLDTNTIAPATCAAPIVAPTPTPTSTPVIVAHVSTLASTATVTPVVPTPFVSTPTLTTTPAVAYPGAPNTGAGGDAPETFLVLFLSAVLACSGLVYLQRYRAGNSQR